MPTWLKVVLIVGGLLFVLLIVAVVGVVYVAKKYGPQIVEAGQKTYAEGVEYGRLTDNEGCVNEAAARHVHVNGFTAFVRNGVFMEACLEASRPTPGFCDTVPGEMEFLKGASWQQQQCKRYGLKPESQCGQLFQGVQRFCDKHGRGGAKGGAGVSDEDAGDSEPSAPPTNAPRPSR